MKPSTLGRRLAAICYAHRQAGFDPPQARPGSTAIKNAIAGIRRVHGVKPVRKRAADGDVLRDMLRAIEGDSPRAVRDRALLAVRMTGALRRSELVALEMADVGLVTKGKDHHRSLENRRKAKTR